MPRQLSGGIKVVAVLAVVSLSVGGAVAASGATGAALTAGDLLPRESLLTPDELGDGAFDGLQYADATEGLVLVDAPEPASDGGAHLSYPIAIPAGRGISPELSIDYDSSGGNAWVGLGWDLGVGEIAVDTSFGVPYFDPAKESESYTLDGDRLVPNALGDTWEAREPGDREDFVRQVETEYEQIIRHEVGAGGPKNYFWEVRSADGSVRWYGGTPDVGGPDGGGATIDTDAIVTDDDGNQVRWLLSAKRDIGYSTILYRYKTYEYHREGAGWKTGCGNGQTALCARHTYLDHIDYTAAASASGQAADPAYRVLFQLESELGTGRRDDPIVDGTGRYLDLVWERLGRIEVRYGHRDASGARSFTGGDYDIAARYDLDYRDDAPFGKSLLKSITQGADDPAVAATHTFTYYDQVGDGSGGYDGFGTAKSWSTGNDMGNRTFLDENVSAGALGGSESNSAEGHAYVGFNPVIPQKVGSVGVSLQVGGGQTTGLEEWIDLNGDGLPDKVFRKDGTIGGALWYRLNLGEPGADAFSSEVRLPTLESLSVENSVDLQFSVEAHVGPTASFGLGTSVAWGDTYFADANADGLPDLVKGGSVLFNRLVDGVPTFTGTSGGTPVPIVSGAAPDVVSDQIAAVRQQLEEQSPPVDTVRRWIAPFSGTVEIDAPVTLDPAKASPDGVRVAIENDGTEVASAILTAIGDTAFTAVQTVVVERGSPLYFRVGSRDDGANDEVVWAPVIRYTKIGGKDVADAGEAEGDEVEVPLDVNGLSQTVYDAAADFTLSGRPGTRVVMPYDGTVRVTGQIEKTAKTTDDLKLMVLYDGQEQGTELVVGADFVGTQPFEVDFDVEGPVESRSEQHWVSVHLAVDSPIDLTAVSWDPTLVYLDAKDADGNVLDVTDDTGAYIRSVDLTPEVEQFPIHSSTAPVEPWTSTRNETVKAIVRFDGAAPLYTDDTKTTPRYADAIITVKSAAGQLVQKSFTLEPPGALGVSRNTVGLGQLDIEKGTDYWFEVTTRDVEFAQDPGVVSVVLEATDDEDDHISVTSTFYGADIQGIFPLAYRGWGIAGYTANGDRAEQPIKASAFVIDVEGRKSKKKPNGFEDVPDEAPDPDPSFAYIAVDGPELDPLLEEAAGSAPLAGVQWRGNRDNLTGGPERLRSSRLASDSVALGDVSGASAGGPTRVSVAPSAALAFGFGPLGASVGSGLSQGLVDYEDLNGDGFPDVLTPGNVQYTTQRGALNSAKTPTELGFVNQDYTVSAQGGLEAGLVDIKPNNKGRTNATSGSAAGKGGDAANDGGLGAGFGVSIGGGVDGSWTNANNSGLSSEPFSEGGTQSADVTSKEDASKGELDGPIGQQELADVNGDGLPDRVTTTADGVFVEYNLGYSFTKRTELASGGFGTQESIGGSASVGFATPWGEFSGGASFVWNYDMVRYAWVDVNGDGILDRLHKAANAAQPTVTFGTGSGLSGDPVVYGDFAKSAGVGAAKVEAAPHIGYDRSQGIGGGFDFTIYAGPLCLVACYLVINPGASFQNSVSFTEVTLDDINGDGYVDSLSSTDDNEVSARVNQHGRTNLLKTVENPLGGSIAMKYRRDGNTYDHPDSIWTMSKVSVDDGRPGDGVDVLASKFEYSGLRYDRLFRQPLGYDTVVEHEIDSASRTPLRDTTRTYLNDSVFTAGLETSTVISDPATGAKMRGAYLDWGFRSVEGYDPAGPDVRDAVTTVEASALGDLGVPAFLGASIAPLVTGTVEEWYGDGGAVIQDTRTEFTYDGLGNVLTQDDLGETEDPDDDVRTTIVYSDCEISSGMDPQCPAEPAHPVSPFWSGDRCPTWVSMPAVVTVTNGKSGADEVVYRHTDGRTSLCENASVTHLEERVDDDTVAVTDLGYDAWGSYATIVYPAGEDGTRYAVEYTYDAERHSDIAKVTEYDLDDTEATYPATDADGNACGPISGPVTSVEAFVDGDGCTVPVPVRTGLTSTATFDGPSGRVASRTDANGNTTSYTYDALGRITSISNPLQADVVTFEYHPSAPDYGYAIARHADVFNDDPIVTVSFVDGIGRVTEEKRDARVVGSDGAPTVGRIVTGATNFDSLGRAVEQYRPVVDSVGLTEYEYATSAPDTVTTTAYTLSDLETLVVEPGGRRTSTSYDVAEVDGVTVFTAATTDPRDRVRTTYSDIRDNVRALDDAPDGLAPLRTSYEYDGIGQLLRVVDSAGEETLHTYDQAGNRLSTETPDGGLVAYAYDAEGKLISEQSPTLREEGYYTTYAYELHHLVGIDYPEDTPDVTYTYGGAGAPGNGAGRVVQVEDGSQILSLEYDALGAATKQSAEIKLHNWTPDVSEPENFTWVTEWTYDGLGRLAAMVYPDGERLTYDYDAGGLVKSVAGEEDGYKTVPLLDAAGNVVLDEFGFVVLTQVPHTWSYDYVDDRRYDEFLRPAAVDLGNGVTTEWSYDEATQWLTGIHSDSANRDLKDNPAEYSEIQDLRYTYDLVGNPLSYDNALPPVVSNLFSGPTRIDYEYDEYDRLTSASATHEQWTDERTYEFALSYDEQGNIVTKSQIDKLGKKVQSATTTSFDRTYATDDPHQVDTSDAETFHYDADGELTQITVEKGRKTDTVRQMDWDWAGHMVRVDEGGPDTEYTYDGDGSLAIERGPAGETAFVNPWVTVRNGQEIYKHIWVDDDRIATQRDDGGVEEVKRYFLHKDLQGSTNIVTDAAGDTFQHHEYFPTGEVWVDEHNTVFRTPYQYAGGYTDEQRDLISLGDRWYDARRELFTTTDPELVENPSAVIDSPELRAAYAYAGSNPMRYTDPTGYKFEKLFLNSRADEVVAKAAASRSDVTVFPSDGSLPAGISKFVPKWLARFSLNADKRAAAQDFAERWSAKPLISIDLNKSGKERVEFTPFLDPRKKAAADAGGTGGSDATGQGGGPSTGSDTAVSTGSTGTQAPGSPGGRGSGGPDGADGSGGSTGTTTASRSLATGGTGGSSGAPRSGD